jgi:hypothetical protein
MHGFVDRHFMALVMAHTIILCSLLAAFVGGLTLMR